MIKPTAEHLTRRACRVEAIREKRAWLERNARYKAKQQQLADQYRAEHHDAVVKALVDSANQGRFHTRYIIPRDLLGKLRDHVVPLGVMVGKETNGIGQTDLQVRLDWPNPNRKHEYPADPVPVD